MHCFLIAGVLFKKLLPMLMLDHCFLTYSEIPSRSIKFLNENLEILELLEEKIGEQSGLMRRER